MSNIAKPKAPTRAARQKAVVPQTAPAPVEVVPPQPAPQEVVQKPKRVSKPPVPPPSSPIPVPEVAQPCTPTQCKRRRGPCGECGQKIRKPRTVTNPTDKQLASRAAFKDNVGRAKALQQAEPGLSYKEAIKRVYGK